MTLQGWIGAISGLLAILGVLVAVTRYLTRVQEQAEREKIAAENRELQRKLGETEARRDQLLTQIEVAGRAGSAALHQKAALDDRLRSLMIAMGASGGSIYLPVHSPRGPVHGLAFLCIEPFSVQTQALRAKMIPLKSVAGRCFTDGKSFRVENAGHDSDRFTAADKIVDYRPATMLNIALRDGADVVGVLQLLRKEGEEGFSEADVGRVSGMAEPIAAAVAELARGQDCLKLLGLDDGGAAVEGTILYFDLSKSSLLFQELSTAFALQLLNEYFEQVCEPAFRLGATLDNYMGDGALLRFNVPRPQPDHALAAVQAAIDMNRAFAELKDYWIAISPRLALVQHRAGIATGPLLRASLGHSQLQRLTVIGYPISVAAALCEAADRSRNIVIASAETHAIVKDRVIAQPIAREQLGKAAHFTEAAWEITGLR